jgi:hypothetical protein
VLQLQVAPDQQHGDASAGCVTGLPQSFADQLHLLGGRMEVDESPDQVRRVSVFIDS